ncbi:MAG: DUF6498-containing protein [Pseudomonadota bacterium]
MSASLLRVTPVRAWPASAWLLVVVNLIPVVGVLVLDWEVLTVLVLFWLENVMVGVVNLIRMGWVSAPLAAKLFNMGFFSVHYGGFALGHGFAVTHFFGDGSTLDLAPQSLWTFVQDQGLVLAGVAIGVSHLVSFALNDLGSERFRAATFSSVMQEVYRRVIVLHVTILVGGFLVTALGSPVWALLVLVALKTILDLNGHLNRLARGQAAGEFSVR